MMKKRTLPQSLINLSVICLGSGGFGTAIAKDEAFAIMDVFFENGGNFADTAHVYADWAPNGRGMSERTLGSWIRDRGIRHEFYVGTKGAHPALQSMHISRLDPESIRADLYQSLERLQTEYIDLYWLHRDDPKRPVDEIIDVLEGFRSRGFVRSLGVSNWSTKRLHQANEYAKKRGWIGFQASQIGWSLAKVNAPFQGLNGCLYMDDASLSYYTQLNFPVVAYTSQAQGFFSEKYRFGEAAPEGSSVGPMFFSDDNFIRLERAQSLAKKLGTTANNIALASILNHKFPSYAIVGPRNVEQIRASCASNAIELTDEQVKWLEGEDLIS